MSDELNMFLIVFAGLFPIVNPLGGAPFFLNLTRGSTADERHGLAGRVAFNSFWLLLGSLLWGSYVMEFFGITLPSVRIAGGIVVTVMGWKMLSDGTGTEDGRSSDLLPAGPKDGFYPLTLPMTVGPGSMSVAVALGSHRPHGISRLALLTSASAVAGVAAICAAIFIVYRFADSVLKLLGDQGVNIFIRLSAFIMMCIGIEILWGGASALIATLHGAVPPTE